MLEPAAERYVPRRSRLLLSALWTTHLLAAGAILFAAAVGWWRLPLLSLVAWSLLRESRRARAICMLEILDERWRLTCVDGRVCEGRLGGDTFVHPWLVVLHCVDDAEAQVRAILLPDSLGADAWRRLRVRLRREMARGRARREMRPWVVMRRYWTERRSRSGRV